MTAPKRRLLTASEREMLTAIRELLDIPQPATYEGRQGYYDTLTRRAAELAGCLKVAVELETVTPEIVTRSARQFAAGPLEYAPESPQEAARRRAEYQAEDGAR